MRDRGIAVREEDGIEEVEERNRKEQKEKSTIR